MKNSQDSKFVKDLNPNFIDNDIYMYMVIKTKKIIRIYVDRIGRSVYFVVKSSIQFTAYYHSTEYIFTNW